MPLSQQEIRLLQDADDIISRAEELKKLKLKQTRKPLLERLEPYVEPFMDRAKPAAALLVPLGVLLFSVYQVEGAKAMYVVLAIASGILSIVGLVYLCTRTGNR